MRPHPVGWWSAADAAFFIALCFMVATIVLGMLCVHLLCFTVMFLLMGTRLHGKKMGMEVFALGNFMLGCAYILQLLGGGPQWNAMSLLNHTLTLCAPVAYVLGGMRFFDMPTTVWRPLCGVALVYTTLQVAVQYFWGTEERHALLAATCALLFLMMTFALLYGARTFGKHLRAEMLVFSVLVAGIGVLNAIKFYLIVNGGLQALNMNNQFQLVFYLYMSFLGTVIPPAIVWLVLSRLTDKLSAMATRDPLTGLLNRRGLLDGLQAHFRARNATPAHVLMVDIDHFKQINDTYGHKAGDLVLSNVGKLIAQTAREGDLSCRLGGEEFVVVAFGTHLAGALLLAERIRESIAHSQVPGVSIQGPMQCTVTVGVSEHFCTSDALEQAMHQADTALYRGKSQGRNRVEQGAPAPSPLAPSVLTRHSDMVEMS